jgi:hypothetical protein
MIPTVTRLSAEKLDVTLAPCGGFVITFDQTEHPQKR